MHYMKKINKCTKMIIVKFNYHDKLLTQHFHMNSICRKNVINNKIIGI